MPPCVFSCLLSLFFMQLIAACYSEYSNIGASKHAERAFRRACMLRMFCAAQAFMAGMCCGLCFIAVSSGPDRGPLMLVLTSYALSAVALALAQWVLDMDCEVGTVAVQQAAACKEADRGACEPLLSGPQEA